VGWEISKLKLLSEDKHKKKKKRVLDTSSGEKANGKLPNGKGITERDKKRLGFNPGERIVFRDIGDQGNWNKKKCYMRRCSTWKQ